jgi:hypothetical protein
MSANVGVLARGDPAARDRYCASLRDVVAGAALDADSVYVLDEAGANGLRRSAGAQCDALDGVWACRRLESAGTP